MSRIVCSLLAGSRAYVGLCVDSGELCQPRRVAYAADVTVYTGARTPAAGSRWDWALLAGGVRGVPPMGPWQRHRADRGRLLVGPGPSAASHGGGVPTHRTKAALDFKSEQTDEPKGGPGPGLSRLQDLASPGEQSGACQ
jgi:hypothetical protein